MKRINYYEVETITVCPYCGDGPKRDSEYGGCCGESSAHYTTVYETETGDRYETDEVELYKPISDFLRFEVFSALAWYNRKRRLAYRLRDFAQDVYDGETSLILKLRQVTGFQWSKLDCLILKQIHQFPLYYTPPKDIN